MTGATVSPASATRVRLGDRIDGLPTWAGAVIGVIAIVLIWWLASVTLFQAAHSIPGPPDVIGYFFSASAWSDTLTNLGGTLSAAGQGWLWGNLAALVLSGIVLLIPRLEQVATQIAIVTYCLPLVAIGPILVIVAGRLDEPQAPSIVLAALSCFFTTVVGTLLGLRAAPRTSLDVIKAYGGTRLTALRKVQLIMALPNLFAALKIAAPAAFLGAILAEFLGSGLDASLGRAIIAAQSTANAPRLWYLALVSGAVAGLAYFVIGLLGRLVTPWSSSKAEGGRL